MLTLHAEEVLIWFWSHSDGTYLQEYAAKDPPDTILGMVIFSRGYFLQTLEDVWRCVTGYLPTLIIFYSLGVHVT